MSTTRFPALAAGMLATALSISQPALAAPGVDSPSLKYTGAAFVLTNEASGNQIVSYRRANTGLLTRLHAERTGGKGLGVAATTRGLLRLGTGRQYLYAANTGSDSISVFEIESARLRLLQVVPAGSEPVSLAVSQKLLYSVDGGESKGIRGFRIGADGRLTEMPGSWRALNDGAVPGEAQFSPDGSTLLLTMQSVDPAFGDSIDAYTVDGNGYACARPISSASQGVNPYSIAFREDGTMLVAESYGGVPQSSAVTSYQLYAGTVTPIESVPNPQADVQSVAISRLGHVFTASYAAGNVSTFKLDAAGDLVLLNSAAASFGANSRPTDLGMSLDSKFLYQLLRGPSAIGAMQVGMNAHLSNLQLVGTELPEGTPLAGMVVY